MGFRLSPPDASTSQDSCLLAESAGKAKGRPRIVPGVVGLTKALALEAAGNNVLANCIAPGPIATPLVDGISESWKAAKRAELPLGRFGTPAEVAPVALLLASDLGGDLFVGQTLGPNSGDVMP